MKKTLLSASSLRSRGLCIGLGVRLDQCDHCDGCEDRHDVLEQCGGDAPGTLDRDLPSGQSGKCPSDRGERTEQHAGSTGAPLCEVTVQPQNAPLQARAIKPTG